MKRVFDWIEEALGGTWIMPLSAAFLALELDLDGSAYFLLVLIAINVNARLPHETKDRQP